MTKVIEFENFLADIDLSIHRQIYAPIKIVEMDLPKNIQVLDLLYKVYWDQKRFVPYDKFYKEYENIYKYSIEIFRRKIQMCEKCFYKGLPARIYRTWASIITQIHAGYVAESVFGSGSVEMSSELDHQGADFRVTYKDKKLNYQVKKETFSREVRKEKNTKKNLDGKFINIIYKVPNFDIMQNPYKKSGEFRKAYNEFKEDWIDTGRIKLLANGFVIFTGKIFEKEKSNYD